MPLVRDDWRYFCMNSNCLKSIVTVSVDRKVGLRGNEKYEMDYMKRKFMRK